MSKDEIYIEEYTLERLRRIAEVGIDKKIFLNRIETINNVLDKAANQLRLHLEAEVWGKNHPHKHVIRYPENWWEALKDRFAPSWFTDKHKTKEII